MAGGDAKGDSSCAAKHCSANKASLCLLLQPDFSRNISRSRRQVSKTQGYLMPLH